ncbi:hypothetical protein FHQ18_08555 [Deferribacter autotrophicus]|uniref:Uncharacterized protein n=1 Tax=Deferribacter autotrophicus TaxID=500465 RepID=A0A5A8F416_9BACT|nr:hypothetical protein [Deferribacter autotrophicus]KAA0257783.1 hypothetical protein FHQ18_08555 [Deferribacter autotrophicus]
MIIFVVFYSHLAIDKELAGKIIKKESDKNLKNSYNHHYFLPINIFAHPKRGLSPDVLKYI